MAMEEEGSGGTRETLVKETTGVHVRSGVGRVRVTPGSLALGAVSVVGPFPEAGTAGTRRGGPRARFLSGALGLKTLVRGGGLREAVG